MATVRSKAPFSGTSTESLAERSSLNAYNTAKARSRGWVEHVAKRLQGSDVWKAYFAKMPPGLAERLAMIATQACAENLAGKRPDQNPPECIRKGLAIWHGTERAGRIPGTGPGCDACAYTGVQINDEDREVIPCGQCATSIMVATDGDDTGHHDFHAGKIGGGS